MKKMLRMLVVLAMLLGLFVISASAAEMPCSGTHGDGWTAVSSAQEITATGNYYLANDITGTIKVTTADGSSSTCVFDIRANDVTLCLGGHSVKPTKSSIGIRVHNNVTGFKLCNCVQADADISGNPTTGLVIGNRNRSLIMLSGSETEMYDNVHLNNNSDVARQNSIVQINSATFTMYGGTISNNHFSTDGANAANVAAVLHALSGSTVNLQGGEISGNTVAAAAGAACLAPVVVNGTTLTIGDSFVMDGNTVIDDRNYCGFNRASGILTMGDSSTVTMTGGTISNNKGGYSGGIQLGIGTFTMSGGAISGNEGVEYGGGVDLIGGPMTMSGGTISNNKLTDSKPYGTQVAVRYYKDSSTTSLNMTDGVICAEDEVSSNDLTVLRGIASISGATITGNVGTVGAGAQAILKISGGTIDGNLSRDEIAHPGVGSHAACTITISGGKFSDATEVTKLEEWLASDTKVVSVTEGEKVFHKVEMLFCDGSHSGWTLLNDHFGLFYYPNGRTISSSGNYYLRKDITGCVTGTDGASYAIEVTADNVTVCLGSYSVKPSDDGVVAIRCAGKNLKIVSCSTSNGVITGNNAISILVEPGCSVEIGNNVKISGASITATESNPAPIMVGEGAAFALSGGTISSNTVTSTIENSYVAGAIAATNATVILEAGTISGNKVTQSGTNGFGSGAVTMTGGTLNISRSVVINANTTNKHGGGVALYGTNPVLVMTGGTISNNKASTGGGVELASSSARFTMSGGTITSNTGARWGGGVDIRKGTFDLSGGVISKNTLTDGSFRYGNQVCVGLYNTSCSGTFHMTGGTIMQADQTGTPSYQVSSDVTASYGTANINGGFITGQVGTLGVPSGATTLNIAGGQITGDVTNAIILPTSATNDTQDKMELLRKACTINITGGEIVGEVIETSNANRTAATTTSISGGKFSNATTREKLVEFLDAEKGILSVVSVDENELAYEVSADLVYNGAYMEFGSSLNFGLYVGADIGDYTSDLTDYTFILTGGDEDVASSLSVQNGNLFLSVQGIAAKEMRDEFIFTLEKGGEVWFSKTMSVYDAACQFRADELEAAQINGTEPNSDYITMLADMIHYGTQAQKRFSYNNRSLLTKPDLSGTSETVISSGWTSEGVSVTEGQGSKVSVSLSLKEQIELNFYIRDAKANVTNVVFDGVALEKTDYTVTNSTGTNDAYTLVSFCEIPVKLAKETACFTVELSDGTQFAVSGSIVDYVNLAAGNSTEEKLIDALQKYVDSVIDLLPDDSIDVDTGAVAAYVSLEEDMEQ